MAASHSNKGMFMISLDCEGKWGMADHLQPYHHAALTTDALTQVYERLVRLFAEFEIPVTFAFVMAFVLGEDEVADFPELLPDGKQDDWLQHYWRDRADGRHEGWHQPDALEIVRTAAIHEIGSHSFCHRPLLEGQIDEASVEAELAAATRVADRRGVKLETLVFPRNQVAHVDRLSAHGIAGYRTARSALRFGPLRLSLLREFMVAFASDPVEPDQRPVPIPAGHFLNWRHGPRRHVPPAVTTRRWRSMVDHAAANGGLAHMWFHPHNLITAPDTEGPLRAVLAHVAKRRDAGEIEVVTQRDYSRRMAVA